MKSFEILLKKKFRKLYLYIFDNYVLTFFFRRTCK